MNDNCFEQEARHLLLTYLTFLSSSIHLGMFVKLSLPVNCYKSKEAVADSLPKHLFVW